jgi:hypothetical protein
MLAIETDFSKPMRRWSQDLAVLHQNRLLRESEFLSFARDCGLAVTGIISGEPGKLHREGFLSADGRSGKYLLFHPFRLYVMQQALLAGERISPERARIWNNVADLAIVLEPLFWPEIVGHVSYRTDEAEHARHLARYKQKLTRLLRRLDVNVWAIIHETLRKDAAWIDSNRKLYILLRLSLWTQRKALRGSIAGALWLRHLAEVIRRGFEEVHTVEWPEEDQGFGYWPPGARTRHFGSERPYDDPLRSKAFIAQQFGLFTGSALRWYVEGETEYYAILHFMENPSEFGIELVNLRGEISVDRRNAARKLEDALKEDLTLRRFSIISFDQDLKPNIRAVQAQIRQGNVVGLIDANDPDFEFANFSIDELVEVAARIDDRLGFDGGKLRRANWQDIKGSQAFADQYRKISDRRSSLKGKLWGEALADWAVEHPSRSNTGADRPFVRMISLAFWAWNSNYEYLRDRFEIDPHTFESGPRRTL